MTTGLASRGRRLLSAAVAIVIGTAFLTASLVVLGTAKAGTEEAVAAGFRDADLVVSRTEAATLDAAGYDKVAALDGVGRVRGETTVGVHRGQQDFLPAAPVPVAGVSLLAGDLPAATGEVLINQQLADDGFGPGDALEVTPFPGPEGERPPVTLTVSGVADLGPTNPVLDFGPGLATTDATLRSLDPMLTYDAVVLHLQPGATEAQVRAALADAIPGAEVQTGPEAAEARVATMTGETEVFAAVLLGFGAVALLTAAIVIANTFTITLAQRTGELALLRCIGATRAQVRRWVVLEAVVLGAVASAAGVGLGVAAGAGLVALGRRLDLGVPLDLGLQLDPVSLLLPVLVGTVVTVLASLWPAVRATRVSPLAALRPVGPAADRFRMGWVRLALSLALVGSGVAAMLYAASARDVLAGVAGGVVSFVGVLVGGTLLVPAAVRALGVGARAAGVPGRLAVDNAVRHPGRAAATSAALLVGVTLITMTSVGAATGERTALGEIDKEYAVDLLLTSGSVVPDETGRAGSGESEGEGDGVPVGGPASPDSMVPVPLSPLVADQLADVRGVAEVVTGEVAPVVLGESWAVTTALAVDPQDLSAVVRSAELVASLEPGTVGLSDLDLAVNGLEPGDTLTVHGTRADLDLTVVELGLGQAVALHPDTLNELAGDDVSPGGVLARLAADADLAHVMGEVDRIAAADALLVEGGAISRATVVRVLDVLVIVATALLGVAVLIAVVGIANTLSLSVVERHREHALLRGLGLTRGQMRGMLLTEGVLLAVVSAGLGLTLGMGYAFLGIQTLLPVDTEARLAVPWARVGVIVGVALLAGVLASVLPARRATRVSPAEGLAAGR
ncbi:ABC transporter permease [Ornithinimicrobium tianjinense]|uniref:ABC transporter permease n=1 Tax=Ornithinimicrobium tianjinense TaxID=1195761 RepID=A0A917BVB0_9MICO|nr:ABC transporter permease [Ornithinimicrobium tianjinense]GGF58172.1 ABC transporter permease [Ornithinimicrobium tianjinense]